MTERERPGRAQPLWVKGPRGVLVVGMHRSGTSAATRLVNLLGPATCAPQDMVRGPWNPSGHYESRSLMHLNNALLNQMGRRWWYPPPCGDGYDVVASAVTTTRAEARRAFRRVHHRTPWVWKDPRTSVLLPFWRAALGPRLLSVVVFRDPSEVARSLGNRHDLDPSFGVALWERYNRLILAHSAGMPVLVTRYDDLVHDPVAWSAGVADFLAGEGMTLGSHDPSEARAFVDPELRHSTVPPAERPPLPGGAARVLATLEGVAGAHRHFVAPDLSPEPPEVERDLATVGPEHEPAWRPPPWASEEGGPSAGRA